MPLFFNVKPTLHDVQLFGVPEHYLHDGMQSMHMLFGDADLEHSMQTG